MSFDCSWAKQQAGWVVGYLVERRPRAQLGQAQREITP